MVEAAGWVDILLPLTVVVAAFEDGSPMLRVQI